MRLKQIGVKTSLLDSRLILQEVLNINYEELLVSATRIITEEEVEKFEALLLRRIKREPVSKIFGRKDFWKYTFKTNKFTLDPRPETETLIDAVLSRYKDHERELKILDLGTGTGCLLITLLKEYPNATGLGVDISMEALQVAGENANNLEVMDRANFIKGNWLDGIEEKFDIIVSNPPYIKTKIIDSLPSEVRFYDPISALDGGESGLDCYEQIMKDIEKNMNAHAHVFFEIGKWQEMEVPELITGKGFEIKEVKKDLLGIPRIIEFNKPYLKVIKH